MGVKYIRSAGCGLSDFGQGIGMRSCKPGFHVGRRGTVAVANRSQTHLCPSQRGSVVPKRFANTLRFLSVRTAAGDVIWYVRKIARLLRIRCRKVEISQEQLQTRVVDIWIWIFAFQRIQIFSSLLLRASASIKIRSMHDAAHPLVALQKNPVADLIHP